MTDRNKILTAEQEEQLLRPIDEYIGNIQAKIDELRKDGTTKVTSIQSDLDSLKRDRIYTKEEKAKRKEQLTKQS